MLVLEQSDYGDLFPVVKAGGWLISAAWFLILGWRGRSKKWAPVQEEIVGGPARIARVTTAVGLAVVWYYAAEVLESRWLVPTALAAIVATVVFFLINDFALTTLIY